MFFFVVDAALEELIREVVRASNRGVSAERNATGEPNWSFGQSLFFASTVVTTIGKYNLIYVSEYHKTLLVLVRNFQNISVYYS